MSALRELTGEENSDEGSRTFVLDDEGHTLGNALKMIITRYPEVNFCGYTIPHPTDNKVLFRIQCKDRAIDVLKRGLEDLHSICDHSIETFEAEVKQFNEKSSNKVQAT